MTITFTYLPSAPWIRYLPFEHSFASLKAASFAKAADTLNLPRSSVSKLVQDLEAHFGTKLVEPTTRSVTMTTESVAHRERGSNSLRSSYKVPQCWLKIGENWVGTVNPFLAGNEVE